MRVRKIHKLSMTILLGLMAQKKLTIWYGRILGSVVLLLISVFNTKMKLYI